MTTTPKTKTRNTPSLRIERTSEPECYIKFFQKNWQIVHLPTGEICCAFRLRRSARKVVAWLKANVPSELLAGVDVEAINRHILAAGWIEFAREVDRNEQ